MKLFRIKKYIEYILFSRHRKGHGIHSPFVFELVSDVFRNKIDDDIVYTIENIRKRLLSDPGSISVNDLGSGSTRMKTSLRKVSDIARYSAVTQKYGTLLFNMSRAFGTPLIIEFGTSLGISTMYLACSNPNTIVYTMEGCEETLKIASGNFLEAGIKNIRTLNGSFDDMLPVIAGQNVAPGLVFIDGDHRKESVMRYFDLIADMSDTMTVVILDDIYASDEMAEGWSEIKKHRNVTMTIDIFRMGIVFFREGLNHFDYVIRY